MSSLLHRFTQGHRLILALFVILGALVMIRLGFWQLQRRAERLERNARVRSGMAEPPLRIDGPIGDPAAFEYRQVLLEGTFDYANEVVLLGRARAGAPGVHLLTPLRLAGSDSAVLVDRGWIPYDRRDPAAREEFRGPAQVALRARLLTSQGRPARSAPAESPPREDQPRQDAWSRVDVPRIQAQTPYPLLPFYVEQLPEPGASGLPWRGAEIALDEGPHLSYAIQWFAFAAILLVGYIATLSPSITALVAPPPSADRPPSK